MIKIKSVTIRNFISVGNATQGVELDKEQLTLVLGENLDSGGTEGSRNGVGKSTLVNALSYALFGQALTSIKKDNLINHVNKKNMLVTVEFEKNGTQYRIERGRRPAVLKFYVNNTEQDIKDDDGQGDSRETQKDIDNLIGMSHDMFKHIVALNTYTEPFLSMRAADQRAIIEQLLGITVLSEKADSLKEQIKNTKDQIFRANTQIESIKKSNDRIQESINNLQLRQSAWKRVRQEEVSKLEKSINSLMTVDIDKEILDHDNLTKFNEASAKRNSLSKELSTIEVSLIQANKARAKYQSELESLSSNQCPACEQQLHSHKHDEMLNSITAHLNETNEHIATLESDKAELEKAIDEIVLGDCPVTFYDSLDQAYNHRSNLESLVKQLELKTAEKDTYQEQIEELSSTALQEVDWTEINQLTSLKDHQEFLLKLLTNKDSFIRKKIIDQNLAYLNSRLTHYLEKMGLPHQVQFVNDLSVEITQLGQDLDFDNLSRGERNRLILSLSWAFRDVWESLYHHINILFVDELIDNGLDPAGVESALGVLKHMARERSKCVFLISHREELLGRVNSTMKVIKSGGFTSFETDLISD